MLVKIGKPICVTQCPCFVTGKLTKADEITLLLLSAPQRNLSCFCKTICLDFKVIRQKINLDCNKYKSE